MGPLRARWVGLAMRRPCLSQAETLVRKRDAPFPYSRSSCGPDLCALRATNDAMIFCRCTLFARSHLRKIVSRVVAAVDSFACLLPPLREFEAGSGPNVPLSTMVRGSVATRGVCAGTRVSPRGWGSALTAEQSCSEVAQSSSLRSSLLKR